VVEKLTKNVHESHLREIFGSYGEIKDVDLPLNKQCRSPSTFSYIFPALLAPLLMQSLFP